jgi:uncharacterized cupin superfamily protein
MKAHEAPARVKPSNYPSPFAERMIGRIKRPLGDLFGLKNFGVNLTLLQPGCVSALHHRHSRQDEFIYVLKGNPTLHVGSTQVLLEPGMCAGFPAAGAAHHLQNDTDEDVFILEVGDRSPGDVGTYPDDDLEAAWQNENWVFMRKDGTAY